MKEGYYAVYKGKEYKAAYSPDLGDNDIIMLMTEDVNGLRNGFTKGFYGITKKVKRDELDTAYSIKVNAIYQGYQFQVSEEKDGRVLLYTSDWGISQKLNMEQTDKFSFHKWVTKDEIEKAWEQKEPLWGFTP